MDCTFKWTAVERTVRNFHYYAKYNSKVYCTGKTAQLWQEFNWAIENIYISILINLKCHIWSQFRNKMCATTVCMSWTTAPMEHCDRWQGWVHFGIEIKKSKPLKSSPYHIAYQLIAVVIRIQNHKFKRDNKNDLNLNGININIQQNIQSVNAHILGIH